MAKYQQIIDHILNQRQQGALAPGDKVPSLRSLAQSQGVSLNTVIRAFEELTATGVLKPNPRSGFVLTPEISPLPQVQIDGPKPVSVMELFQDILQNAARSDLLPMGSAHPSVAFPAIDAFYAEVARQSRQQPHHLSHYQLPPGPLPLRKQVARLGLEYGLSLDPEEVIITQGGQQAVSLCLQTVTQPGDVVAVDTPSYYGTLLVLQALGLKVLEIPSLPAGGLDPVGLKEALERYPVKAFLMIPTVNNPTGHTLSLADRRSFLDLTGDIPIVEDDIFGVLSFDERPPTLKSLDDKGRVLYCSSLSKTMDSRIRIGWAAPGRYHDQALLRQQLTSLGGVNVIQDAVTAFLQRGSYDKHLRRVRRTYRAKGRAVISQLAEMLEGPAAFSQPQGGFLTWLNLPPGYDGMALYREALEAKISVLPGEIFSTVQAYKNCIRLSFAHYEDNAKWQAGLAALAQVINRHGREK